MEIERTAGNTSEENAGVRINKYLASAGICSRRQAEEQILRGRVEIVTEEGVSRRAVLGDRVLPGDKVLLEGRTVEEEERKILLLFNKPAGLVCSTVRQRDETTVIDHIRYPVRIYPVGRLDKDSEGLLLLTNQGDLVNRIMKASACHEKEYVVRIDRPVTRSFVEKMAGGVPVLGVTTRPCRVWKTGTDEFHIILTQGLNRQIRRMCSFCGCKVLELKRIRIMNLTLEGLETGAFREMTGEEWKELQRLLDRGERPPGEKRTGSYSAGAGSIRRASSSGRKQKESI